MNSPDRARPARLTLRAFFDDAADELLSLDRGLPYTILTLFRAPAKVVREYIDWRSARVTRPLRYFLIVVLFVNAIAALTATAPAEAPPIRSSSTAQAEKPPRILFARREVNGSVLWVAKNHPEWLLLFTVPLLALATRHAFRGAGYNYAEHWVLALYGIGHAYWLVVARVLLLTLGYEVAAAFALALAPLLFGWICADVFEGSRPRNLLRGLYAVTIASVAAFAIAVAATLAIAMISGAPA